MMCVSLCFCSTDLYWDAITCPNHARYLGRGTPINSWGSYSQSLVCGLSDTLGLTTHDCTASPAVTRLAGLRCSREIVLHGKQRNAGLAHSCTPLTLAPSFIPADLKQWCFAQGGCRLRTSLTQCFALALCTVTIPLLLHRCWFQDLMTF